MTDQCPFCRGYCGVVSGCQLEAAQKQLEAAQKDVADLNRLLRDVGWGQGEIDTAAVVSEENEQLRGALRKLVDAAKDIDYCLTEYRNHGPHEYAWMCCGGGYPEPGHKDDCDYAAAIAEAERLLRDAT